MNQNNIITGLAILETKEEVQKARDEEAKKNKDFIQINITYGVPALWQVVRANPLAMEVLLIFMGKMDSKNAIGCSSNTLEIITGKSRPSIYRATKWLRENKYLKITKQGTMNIYHLSPHIIWKSWANTKKHAVMKDCPKLQPESLAITKAVKTKRTPIIDINSPK